MKSTGLLLSSIAFVTLLSSWDSVGRLLQDPFLSETSPWGTPHFTWRDSRYWYVSLMEMNEAGIALSGA